MKQIAQLYTDIDQLKSDYTSILPLALEIRTRTAALRGEQCREYAVALNELASVYRHLEQYEQAEPLFLQAASILSETVGVADSNYATVLNNLAGLYRLTAQYDQAEQLFKAVLLIYYNSVGAEHFLTLSALNNLGLVYQATGRYDQANDLHQACLRVLEQSDEHPIAYATTLNNIAMLKQQAGDRSAACQLTEKALKIYQTVLGTTHPLYRDALKSYTALAAGSGQAPRHDRIDQTPACGSVIQSVGMRLCQRYFEQIAFPTLQQCFPTLISRMAMGLVGEGSECFGFDDEISQDHDFGPRLMVWLTDEDYAHYGDAIQLVLKHMPQEFEGIKVPPNSQLSRDRSGVFTISSFYANYLGLPQLPHSLDEWRKIPEEKLAIATNGWVFYDALGEFSYWRAQLSQGYPQEVCLQKMAARCMTMAQAGQYNLPRALKRGEWVTLQHALAAFIEAAISFVFLLNHQYKPFYKWMHRGLKSLPQQGNTTYEALQRLVSCAPAEQVVQVEALCQVFINELTRMGLSTSNSCFLLDHAPALLQHISLSPLQKSNPQSA